MISTEKFMKLAIQAAKFGRGQTFTNPLVGAILVAHGEVVGIGAHLVYGEGHAERNAIDSISNPEVLSQSTLYVTLEPCNHQGKQPPCTQLIVDSKISKVVVGQLDPNPLVAGKGIAFLQDHGVEVVKSKLIQEVEALNPYYDFYYRQKRPWITLKQAVTLDGKVNFQEGQRSKITNSKSLQRVHQERQQYQGILVGSQTVLVDNPTLRPERLQTHMPVRVVLDRRGRLLQHLELQLFKDSLAPVYLFTKPLSDEKVPQHVRVFQNEHWTIPKVVEQLAKLGIQSLYVEGGAKIHQSFLASGLWDDLITYVAPTLAGQGQEAFGKELTTAVNDNITINSVEQLGPDLRIHAKKVRVCSQESSKE